MTSSDTIVLVAYFVPTLGAGVWFARTSASGLRSYFLGDNQQKWWMIGGFRGVILSDLSQNFLLARGSVVVGVSGMMHYSAAEVHQAVATGYWNMHFATTQPGTREAWNDQMHQKPQTPKNPIDQPHLCLTT